MNLNELNWNDVVKVKLTDYGKYIYYHQFDELIKRGAKLKPAYPETDENGFSEFQLWEFMQLYGPHIGLCTTPVCEDCTFYINESTSSLMFIKPRDLTEKEISEKLDSMRKYGIVGVDDSSIEIIPTRKEIEKETALEFARQVEFHSISRIDCGNKEYFTISSLALREILRERFGLTSEEIDKMYE